MAPELAAQPGGSVSGEWAELTRDPSSERSLLTAEPFDWKFAASSFDAVYERATGYLIQRIVGVDIHVKYHFLWAA